MIVPTKHRYRLGLLALVALGAFLSGCQKEGDSDRICSYRKDCADGERCGTDGKCTKEEQVCKTDSACSFDEFCKFSGGSETGKCEAAACSSDGDCGTQATCNQQEGVCKTKGCDPSDAKSCPAGEVCDAALEQCVSQANSCRDNQDCGQLQRCEIEPGKAVGECKYTGRCRCENEEDCKTSPTGNGLCAIYGQEVSAGGDMYCDSGQGRCQLESTCRTDRDCGGNGLICVTKHIQKGDAGSNICVPGCRQVSDCSNKGGATGGSTRQVYVCKQHPNPENDWKICLLGCYHDSDCSDDGTQACLDNACVRTCVLGVADSCLEGQLCKSPKSGVSFSICDNCRNTSECEKQIQGTECRPPEGTELPSTEQSEIDSYCSGPQGNCICQKVEECPPDGFRTKENPNWKTPTDPYVIKDSDFVTEEGGTLKYTTEGVSSGPLLCTDKQHAAGDFYKFTAKGGYVVRVMAKTAQGGSIGAAENIDLQLLDCSGTDKKPLLFSARPPWEDKGGEEVSYGTENDKVLCVNVTGSSIERVVKYDLIITQTQFTTCEDDTLAGNQEAANAYSLTSSSGATPKETEILVPAKSGTAGGKREVLHVCSGSADWYKFTVERNTYPEFIFDYDPRLGSPKVEFFEEGKTDGTPLEAAIEANAGPDTVVFGPTAVSSRSSSGRYKKSETRYRYRFATTVGTGAGKTYFMKVSLPEQIVGQVDYQFSWVLHENVCADDGTPNEEASSATPLPLSTTSSDFVYAPRASEESGALEYNVCSKDFYKIELLPEHKLTAEFCYGGKVTDNVDGQPYVNVLKPTKDGSSFVRVEQPSSSINGVDGSTCQQVVLNTQDCDGRGRNNDICPGNYLLNFSLYSGTRVSYKLKYKSEELEGKTCTPRGRNRTVNDADAFDSSKAGMGADNIRLGRICDQNHDWYSVHVDSGVTSKFSLLYNATAKTGDLDYTIYFVPDGQAAISEGNKDGYKVDNLSKIEGEGSSVVELTPSEAGTYYIDIYGSPAARLSYTLSLEYAGKGPAGGECPDRYESNDDLTHATVLKGTSTPDGDVLNDLSICYKLSGNTRTEFPDYFKADLEAGETASFVAGEEANARDNNLSFRVISCFAPFDEPEHCNNTGRNWTGSTVLSTEVKGTVYYKVYGTYSRTADAFITSRYNVKFKKSAMEPACVDVASGTKGATESDPIVLLDLPQQGYYSNELLCPGAAKYFKVTVPKKTSTDEKWSFATRFNRGAARLKVTVKKSGSEVSVAPKELTGNTGTAKIGDLYVLDRPDADTEYTIKVEPEHSRVKYFLLANMDYKGGNDPNNNNEENTIFERLTCPDRFELNNTHEKGKKIGAGIDIQNLFLCQGRDTSDVFFSSRDTRDYYKVDLPPKATLTAKVTTPDGSDIDTVKVGLYNGTTQVVDQSKAIVMRENETGSVQTYDLLAYPTSDSGIVEYKLKVDISYQDTCDSPSEGGGLYVSKEGKTAQELAIAGSVMAEKYYTPGLTKLCDHTQQWYKVGSGVTSFDATLYYVTSYGKLEATLVSTNASGQDLKDATVTPVVDEATGKITFNATSLDSSRTYYLKLATPGDAGRAEYKLWYKTSKGTPTLAMCADSKEINDDATSATQVGQNIFHATDLNLCYADEDWFRITKTGEYYVGLFGENADKITINFVKPDASGSPKTAKAASGEKVSELTVASGETDFPDNNNYVVKLTADKSETSRPYLMLAGPATMFSTSCTPDEYEKEGMESNNAAVGTGKPTPIPLPSGGTGSQTILYATHCVGDLDYYRVEVPTPSTKKYKLTLYTKSTGVPVAMSYLDSSFSPVAITTTSGKAEHSFTSTTVFQVNNKSGETDSPFPYFLVLEEMP